MERFSLSDWHRAGKGQLVALKASADAMLYHAALSYIIIFLYAICNAQEEYMPCVAVVLIKNHIICSVVKNRSL